jgi:dolichol-phosphate mannosyltransferase
LPGAWLILPTYNEAENVEAMLRAALAQLASTGVEHTILVVDDGSPDGTGELADRMAAEHPEVRVMHRPAKQGLGRAYLAGFEEALSGGADLILEMDADFSHDPADLPRLIAAADAADLVLGSRYVPGGGVENWGTLRRFLSRGGSWYARVLLGVPVRDLTGGFKCFNRRVLETLDLRGVHADFTVTEVPILFRERREGQSKMTARIALEAVWKVPALRFRG